MSKKRFTILVVMFILLINNFVLTQENDLCSPEYISTRTAEAVEIYNAQVSENTDDAIATLEDLQDELQAIQDVCQNIASDEPESAGTGLMGDPYVFGTAGDSNEGFTIQVTGFIRPADQIIRSENRFNDRPEDNEVYIIIEVLIECDSNVNGRCETNYFDYELVGSQGTIYESASVVYDGKLDAELLGGGSATGSLPFLIEVDDTDLRLLYRANRFNDEFIVFEAVPSAASGIEVVAAANVNVRSGSGTSFSISSSLSANESVLAFGRNTDGTWLQTSIGWVFAELVNTDGDIQGLPVTSD